MNISIVIFCYNEEGAIGSVVSECQRTMMLGSVFSDHEIIVVNDGSSDNTYNTVETLAKSNPNIRCIHHPFNLGIGMALRTGYEAARMEYICAVPGDGQFDIRELGNIKPFDNKAFYSFYRTQYNYGPYRYMLTLFNKLYNIILLGLDLKDVNWIKVYRKEQILFTDPQMKSSLIESEISAKLLKAGAVAMELPSIYHRRKYGEEKGGSWKTLKKVLSEMWDLYKTVREFKGKLD